MPDPITCTGRGDNGGHCCWINGQVCQFLFTDRGGTPRCGVWDTQGSPEWQAAPVGRWFAKRHPGKTCKDWPQRLPGVMALGVGLCCWAT